MGNIKKVRLFIISAVLSTLFIIPVAHAQSSSNDEGFAASLSPLPILLSTKPGTSTSADLRVNNPSSHNQRYKVVVKTFSQDGPDGKVTLHEPSPSDDFINWIHFDKTVFDAPPGLWQTVKMTVDVPSTAAFGYYYAVEFTGADSPNKQASTGTAIQGAVANFVLLNAQAAGEKKQLQVTSFTADHQVYEFLPATFSIRVHNSGNIFAGATGNIFISRGGKQVAILNVNENKGLIIPGSNRLFTVAWDDGFPVYKTVYGSNGHPVLDKDGNPQKKLSWNFSQVSKLRFGHYTAKLALIYNDGTRDVPITGTVSFWVIPWRVIAVVLGIILLIVGLGSYVIILRRKLKRANSSSKARKKDVS